MIKKIIVSILLTITSSGLLLAQVNVLEKADAMLLNSDYQGVITLVDSNPADGKTRILLETKKAEALIRLGKLDEAGAVLKSAMQKTTDEDFFQRAIIQTSEASLYLNQGRSDLAVETIQKALSSIRTLNKENTLEGAQAISNLGLIYLNGGKYKQAEEQLLMALSIRQKLLDKNHELIAASYNDLGVVNVQLDEDKALEYYESALTIYKTLHGDEHPKIAIANTNMGLVLTQMEQYGEAEIDFETALTIWNKVYPTAHPSKGFVLLNLGVTYSNTDKAVAEEYFKKALDMYRQSYGDKHPEIARVYNWLGDLQNSENKFTAALNSYQQALRANISNFNTDNVSVNPTIENYYDGRVLVYSLLGKAQSLEGRYYGKTIKFSDLTDALGLLTLADQLIDELRQQATNESDKISLGIIAHEVYADGVRLSKAALDNAFKKKEYQELIFYFAEKSKSAALLSAISDANAKSFAGIPQEMLENEKEIKSALTLCSQKLAQKPTVEEEKALREKAFSLNRDYETFIKKLETDYPDYFNLKFNTVSPTIDQITTLLDKKTALISYFIDDSNNRLYVFMITKNKFKVVDHTLPENFDRYITGFRNGLFFNDQTTFQRAAYTLNTILIPVIPRGITEIVFLPTGRLGVIPFEALLTKEASKEDTYASLKYLLSKYSIRYEFSAGLIIQKGRTKPQKENPAIYLCAPVNFSEDGLPDLPGTASEVGAISKLFSEKNYKSSIYLNADAQESTIKSDELSNYSYLHFATHGVVDESNPELSRIYLKADASAEDGKLYTGEIYNLKLNANLVTLSACETGLGKISKGEGVIGLSRALVYAGAKNMIVSFWSVADESTSELMKDFYNRMLDNPAMGYAENLRASKQKLLEGKYAAPYYWAPFVLLGY